MFASAQSAGKKSDKLTTALSDPCLFIGNKIGLSVIEIAIATGVIQGSTCHNKKLRRSNAISLIMSMSNDNPPLTLKIYHSWKRLQSI